MRKYLLRSAIVLAILYVSLVGVIWWAMHQSPETFGSVMKHLPDAVFLVAPFETMWMHARAGSLQTGDPAPDFSLVKLDKSATVELSSLAAKQPVVLVFGSYT